MAQDSGGASSALIGGLVGGGLGAIGGFFESRSQRRAQRRFAEGQRRGIDQSRQIADERVAALLDSPLIRNASQFIQSQYESDTDPLTEQFGRRLRVAQESRGLRRSAPGAQAEAAGLAAFRTQYLTSLLPQAMEFGTLGERTRQGIFAQEVPINIGYHTGAPIPGVSQFLPPAPDAVGSIFGGLASGFGSGFSIGTSYDRLGELGKENDLSDRLLRLLESRESGGAAGGRRISI